jgi:beta-aspartyl-peptidase (threonine type)
LAIFEPLKYVYQAMSKYTLVIHGGAGTILKADMTPDLEIAYTTGLHDALHAGFAVLQEGGSAINAVKAALVILEDNVLFNAGRGSVFTKKGVQEMDAAIMDGKTLEAGAVAGIRNIRNPIELATEVMQNSNHVFLSGKGANDFAIKQGIKLEPDEYFFSQFRYDQWKAIRDSDNYSLDHTHQRMEELMKDKKFGTVGAVACDQNGNIAAATSTGGMTNKKYGRIGDSPMIGSGTYANNTTCAISCTGHGEMFIRAVAAYDVSAIMEYKNYNLQQAMDEVVNKKLVQLEAEGGMIGVDAKGNFALMFNSAGMYRGVRSSDGTDEVALYR